MSDDTQKNWALLSDTPVGEAGRKDHLQFEPTATVLARGAVETSNPLTIGIFGEWGTGKTSLMRLIKEKIDKDKAIAVWFNAWQYEKEKHLIVPLVSTISTSKSFNKFTNEASKSLKNALRSIAYGFSVKGKVGIPLVSEAEVNLSPKDMIERYQDLSKDSVIGQSLYFDAFEELKKYSGSEGVPRIVVFVDDLDRCFPEKAVELLEGIKLVLNQPGFAFVLGVNDAIIQAFIRTKYQKDYGISGSLFEDYLDKIVQVKVPVPKRKSDEMKDYITDLLEDVEIFDEDTKKIIIPLIAEAREQNPRSIVRLINRLIVSSRISNLEGKDFDPIALLISIALDEERYKDLTSALNVEIAKAKNKKVGIYLAEKLIDYDSEDSECIEKLKNSSKEFESPSLDKAIETLDKYKHLCMLFKLKSGQEWLKNKDYRDMMVEETSRTLGESKSETRQEEKLGGSEFLNKLNLRMAAIPAGSFRMGSEEHDSEQPVHKVTLDAFRMSIYPITQAQYQTVMGENPSQFKGPDNPVDSVSWNDAKEFCEKISEKTGRKFTLPSEAQWEYACRAGSETKYHNGDKESDLDKVGWFTGNSKEKTHTVGQKDCNAWGLYDMHGNVWEWCEDCYHDNYNDAPDDGSAWTSPKTTSRVLRGGSWGNGSWYCRSANRLGSDPDTHYGLDGFHVVYFSP
ncbi:MAG: SUMF1/EgtB/PvdO family nonheme iron enzyme [Candidatus Electryonea clarkiae]|nr:SUMF1/EgtB/PvdO family nonheme iron enzyme [Candidatus Electryonea clarkiae]MDP8288166.1 SUMF1/EgtB/PvdO family nonheme iron enzyme [Candidatus Electryonea clarkiae]